MTKLPTSLPSSLISPVSGSAAVPAVSKSSAPEGGGFQATLNQSLKAEVAAQKGAGASPTLKAQASSGTSANAAAKSGKGKERELATTGLTPVLPDSLAALPIMQLPQQILLAQGVAPEAGTSVPNVEVGKLAQAQGLALVGAQTPLPQGDGTSAVPAQSSIADQDIHATPPPPDAASSSKQAVPAAMSASQASAFPSAASSTQASPNTSPVHPVAAKDDPKQDLATNAAAIPIPVVPSAPPINAVPGFVLPNLSIPRITTAPSSKLTSTPLNAGRFLQPADSKPKQSGSALETSSSVPSESRSPTLHTTGTAFAVEPSAPVVAGANGPNSTAIPTGDAVFSAPPAGANGHASADVSGSQTSTDLPATSAANAALQAAAAAPSINSAKVLETIHGTELRLGLHSTEFGSISIATSVSPGGIAAQIALDHGTLSRALATHLTSMEEKLGSSFGLPAKVELRDSMASGLQGNGAGTASANENSRGGAKQQWTGRAAEQPAQAQGGLSGSVAVTESRAVTGNGVRLSVQA